MKRAIAELSIDTQVLERKLLTMAVGEMVSYTDLSALIGRDVRNGARHLLQTARKRVQRDNQMVFTPIWGQGLKRLDDTAIAHSGEAARVKMHNISRRTRQKLACVSDFEALPNDAKIAHNVAMSVFGAIEQVTQPKALQKLAAHVTNGKHDALPTAKFLEAMKTTL